MHTTAYAVAPVMLLWVAEWRLVGGFGWPAENASLLGFAALAVIFCIMSVLPMNRFRRRAVESDH